MQMRAVVTPIAVRKHRMPQRTRGSAECLDPCLLANSLLSRVLLPPRCFVWVAQGRLLQTPLGVQEVTPSTQQMLPASFSTARAFVLHRQMAVQTAIPSLQHIALENSAAWLLRGACCRHLWVCRRSSLQRNSAWAMLIPNKFRHSHF